jgi:hypothetical protein
LSDDSHKAERLYDKENKDELGFESAQCCRHFYNHSAKLQRNIMKTDYGTEFLQKHKDHGNDL